MRFINCCLDCTERRVGCHAICPQYLSQKAIAEERQREINAQKEAEFQTNMYKFEIKKKIKRRLGKRW